MLLDVLNMEQEDSMGNIVSMSVSGDFKKTLGFLKKLKERKISNLLDTYGQRGVAILSANTPVRTGATAASWSYVKKISGESVTLEWHNSNLARDGKTPVVILIIKGHGTRTGGYVPPRDFVTPSMEPLFQEAADAIWKELTS